MQAKWSAKIFALFIIIFSILLKCSTGQDADCDYYQTLEVDELYYVYSRNYPNNYDNGITCRWQGESPPNTYCRLNCSEINLPQTANCDGDRFLVSNTGDSALTGASKYCGHGSLEVVSVSNRISIGFISTPDSLTGRFLCTLQVTKEPTTVPRPGPESMCGWKKQVRIVGGKETDINEYPMMIGLVDINLRIIYCGATIISKRWVLTSAHCLDNQDVSNVAVLIGEHNVNLDDSNATTLVRAAQLIKHPSYTDGYDYDIGLVAVHDDIDFGPYVGPACLPFKFSGDSFEGKSVEALGWGTQSLAGEPSDYLQKIRLDVINRNKCADIMNTESNPNAVTERTICTYTDGKDTCQRDSGGPVLYQDLSSGKLYVVGVILGGYGCATKTPGLNSRVTEHLEWIDSITGISNMYESNE